MMNDQRVDIVVFLCDCDMKRVTTMITSVLGENWGIWMKGREEMCEDMIENILKMIMV